MNTVSFSLRYVDGKTVIGYKADFDDTNLQYTPTGEAMVQAMAQSGGSLSTSARFVLDLRIEKRETFTVLREHDYMFTFLFPMNTHGEEQTFTYGATSQRLLKTISACFVLAEQQLKARLGESVNVETVFGSDVPEMNIHMFSKYLICPGKSSSSTSVFWESVLGAARNTAEYSSRHSAEEYIERLRDGATILEDIIRVGELESLSLAYFCSDTECAVWVGKPRLRISIELTAGISHQNYTARFFMKESYGMHASMDERRFCYNNTLTHETIDRLVRVLGGVRASTDPDGNKVVTIAIPQEATISHTVVELVGDSHPILLTIAELRATATRLKEALLGTDVEVVFVNKTRTVPTTFEEDEFIYGGKIDVRLENGYIKLAQTVNGAGAVHTDIRGKTGKLTYAIGPDYYPEMTSSCIFISTSTGSVNTTRTFAYRVAEAMAEGTIQRNTAELLYNINAATLPLYFDVTLDEALEREVQIFAEFITVPVVSLAQGVVTHSAKEVVTMDDYPIRMGAEFETGIDGVPVALTSGREGNTGCVYSYGYDGGGIELRSVVITDPTLFKSIGYFDTLLKGIRQDDCYVPAHGIGTHIHFSINASKKTTLPGGAMSRKTLISNNVFALYMRYTVPLRFFDVFNVATVRPTCYGMPFVLKPGGANFRVYFEDARYSAGVFGVELDSVLHGFDRESLLRTTTDCDHGNMHFEYRGMDACMSSVFLGLKMELMKAICRKAVAASLEGVKYNPWEKEYEKAIQLVGSVSSFFEVYDIVCRESAKAMIKELEQYMPTYAVKGLRAWAEYVNILDPRVGTDPWYAENEAIIIMKIGTNKIITREDIDNGDLVSCGMSYVPGSKTGKFKFYDRVFSEKSTGTWSCPTVDAEGAYSRTGYCLSCGNRTGDMRSIANITIPLCTVCGDREEHLVACRLPNIKRVRKGSASFRAAHKITTSYI